MDLIFFTSPIGLGHATRDIAISQNLENITKRFVSGGSAAKLFSQNGFDVDDLYIPPPFHIEIGGLKQPLRWLFKYYSYYRACKEISSKVLETYSPNFVISDEDFASLVIAQKKGIKTILVTDILETSFAKGIGSLIEGQMNKSMKKIIKKCDLVILPENGNDEGNLVRVGPIVRKTTKSREQLRERFGFHKKTIVATIGGTDSGRFLIEKILQVFSRIDLEAELVIVSGPSFNLDLPHIRNLGFVNNLHEVVFAADLIISLAGKSTIDESKYYGTPGIFIPIRDHFEQEKNSRELGYTYDDLFRLDKLIKYKLNEKRDPQFLDGAKKASNLIKEFLD